jgi:hypothetical protein
MQRPEHSKKETGIQQGDLVLWCLAGAVALVLWFVPDRTPKIAILGLIALAAFAVVAVLHLPIIRKAGTKRSKILRQCAGIAAVCVVVVVFGLYMAARFRPTQ